MSNESEKGLTTVEDILAAADGIPLPNQVKKSLWKAIGNLILGAVDIPVAYLESKAQKIRNETDAKSIISKRAAQAVGEKFATDPDLINRATEHFGSKLLKEQLNREGVAKKTILELQAAPNEFDSDKEIDEDWLYLFSRIAESKSNKEIQIILAKILAGEIQQPGSFGSGTIQLLTTLDQSTARIFQDFCNISFEFKDKSISVTGLICDPYGIPGSNNLKSLGLKYTNLALLQDRGLIQSDLNSRRKFTPEIFKIPFKIGNQNIKLRQTEESTTDQIQVAVLNFTQSGAELRRILSLESNAEYIEKFIEWVTGRFKMQIAS